MFLIHQDRLADVQHVLVDGAYTGGWFEDLTHQLLDATVQVAQAQ